MIKIYKMNNSTLKSLGLILIWAFVVVLWIYKYSIWKRKFDKQRKISWRRVQQT